MTAAAIIPARGGSKGIPRKNILPIGGKPLLVWSIEQALAARCVDTVWVSTDDDEIAAVATDAGAIVFQRSEITATDTATSESAIEEWSTSVNLYDEDTIVFLQATSPVRQPTDIDDAFAMYRNGSYDSVFSARAIEGYCWSQGAGSGLLPCYSVRQPRQQQQYRRLEENGSLYVFSRASFRKRQNRLGGRIGAYLMHPLDSFQLDTPADIPLIESLLEIRCGSHHAATT